MMTKFKDYSLKMSRSRFPLAVALLICVMLTVWCILSMQTMNKHVNRALQHGHTEEINHINYDHREIRQYHIQENELSDDHTMYLFRMAFYSKRPSMKKPSFKLEKHPSYIKLSKNINRTDQYDDNRIDDLREDITEDHSMMKLDHPRSVWGNAMHNNFSNANALKHRVIVGLVLVIGDLYFIWKIAKFKDNLYKKDIGEA